MVLLIHRQTPIGLKTQTQVGDPDRITDITQVTLLTHGQPRQHQEKGRDHHNIVNGDTRGRARARVGKGVQQHTL